MMRLLALKRKIVLGLIVVALVLNFFGWKGVFAIAGPHYLKVEVLDIGQGDSIFIETPAMRRILIDGGPDSSVLGKLQNVLPFEERNIDMVILTHPDADHINGLLDVLHKYHVENIVWTGLVRDGSAYSKWLELIAKQKSQGSHIIIAKLGDKITSGGAELDILHPFDNLEGQFFGKADNDTGVVAKLIYGKKSFLFTADVSSDAEQKMLDKKVDLASDVLKVGHHGSKYSSSESFVRAVHPSIAAISVGAHNSYGHPTSEVLQIMAEFGINVFRTDRDKDIIFLSDGKNIKVE